MAFTHGARVLKCIEGFRYGESRGSSPFTIWTLPNDLFEYEMIRKLTLVDVILEDKK